jgi:glycosyltransferase involved in cell wall biosynthesis
MLESQKIDVIILTVYYPPIISVASNRSWAFAKYLDKEKYSVKVVTLKESEKIVSYEGVETFYLENKQLIKRATFYKRYPFIIHKTKALWNKCLAFLGVHEFTAWGNEAFKMIDSLISNPENTILISSYPVEEVILVALRIKKKYPQLKWISDLRDGISINPSYPEKMLAKLKKQELDILHFANGITSVSTPILDHFRSFNESKSVYLSEIRNGFDFETSNLLKFNQLFTIAYVGSFYGERSPSFFFHAIESLLKEEVLKDFKIEFVGVGGGVLIPNMLKKYVNVIEKVEYHNAVSIMKSADSLLLILPGGNYKGIYSGKIFDYLGVMKPIIALVDKEDVAAKLIHDCNAGFIANWNNLEEIKSSILKAYQLWETKHSLDFNKELIEQHHRKNQVKKLSILIDELVKK